MVTFSAHNKLYSKYSGNFDKAIRSLRIVATKDFLKMPDRGVVRGSGEIFDTINVHIEGTTIADENPESQNKSIFKNYMFLGVLLLILAALLYIGVKIYKKKK